MSEVIERVPEPTSAEGAAAAEKERGNRRDPELLALDRVCRILDELDVPAGRRAAAYLASRYGPD